jgi:antitoxin VapB
MDTAKIFWSGRSQAVRLPPAFRVEGDEVRIRRRGNALILEPLVKDWSWLDAVIGRLQPDAVPPRRKQPQDRSDLKKLFD